ATRPEISDHTFEFDAFAHFSAEYQVDGVAQVGIGAIRSRVEVGIAQVLACVILAIAVPQQLRRNVVVRLQPDAGGPHPEVAQAGIEHQSEVIKIDQSAQILFVVLQAGLAEGTIDSTGIGVTAAESIACNQRRRQRRVEVIYRTRVEAPATDFAVAIIATHMGQFQPVIGGAPKFTKRLDANEQWSGAIVVALVALDQVCTQGALVELIAATGNVVVGLIFLPVAEQILFLLASGR